MNPDPTSPDDIKLIIDAAIESIGDSTLTDRITPLLRAPVSQSLEWEYGNNESFTAWRFADLGERDVWAAYCPHGHGEFGNPWGLVFTDSDHFGSDYSWYASLQDLFADWFA